MKCAVYAGAQHGAVEHERFGLAGEGEVSLDQRCVVRDGRTNMIDAMRAQAVAGSSRMSWTWLRCGEASAYTTASDTSVGWSTS